MAEAKLSSEAQKALDQTLAGKPSYWADHLIAKQILDFLGDKGELTESEQQARDFFNSLFWDDVGGFDS